VAQAAELAIPGAMDDMHAFFHLHRDLPREGPGCRDDLDRALAFAEIPRGARVLDAGCGSGALEEGRQEAAGWRRVKRETGYLQVVARRA
jgi:hypothetical protein